MIIYLTAIDRNIQDLPFDTHQITNIESHDNFTRVFSTYWHVPKDVKESKEYIQERIDFPEKFNPYYVVSCRDSKNNHKVLGITKHEIYARNLAYIYDGIESFTIEAYEERADNFIMSVYNTGYWKTLDELNNPDLCREQADKLYTCNQLPSLRLWKGLID